LYGELNMRKILPIVVAAVLSAVTFTAAADDPVKTSPTPYKPGRQIGDDSVKTSRSPHKPGRYADQDQPPVKSGQAPHKPGRQAD
jgi:hypothetical protein